ncbi:hypothetical protein AB0D45_16520 [Streptomyces sp. NPDC048352]|uniref:hypothetical protein n=1 Tax=Streptomyces sp. NPDC048352 TaxID=3154718 RepID=UPI00342B8EA9
MIASTAVARWTWGRDSETADLVSSCLADLAAAHSALAEHQMARGEPVVHLSVPEWGNPQNRLFEDEVRLPEGRNTSQVERLCGVVRGALRPGRIGSVDAHVYCSGTRDGEAGGPEERTFLLSASAFEGFVTVELITYSDIWMSHDLRGRAQPDVYAANAPRLSAALQGLAEALGSETDPEDPTYFGKATETGVENFFDSDSRASDVWSSFEIPYRKRRFHHTAVSDVTYKRSAEG